VVASDQHLGYSNSNVGPFRDFLGTLAQRDDVDTFVILGDFVDMWRRDVSGLFLEFNDVLERVLALQQKMKVACVAGNHDFHLLNLANPGYPLKFMKDTAIEGDGVEYVLKHGWEFDPEQQEPIMELLCHNLSDDQGRLRSDVWDELNKIGGSVLDSVRDLVNLPDRDDRLQHLMSPPEVRLAGTFSTVENNAISSVESDQILVFGHTHHPFLNAAKNVANSGSWVSNETTTNTYVELEGKQVRIMQQGSGDITSQVLRN
jgi:UDP-2,3-diacylglucosamine pyrophosphatase LpxH